MKRPGSRVMRTVACAVLLVAAACTSFEPIDVRLPPPGPGHEPELQVGDRVEIVTLSSETFRFRVTAIDDVAVSGPELTIPRDQIQSIAVKRFDRGKAITAGAGGLSFGAIAYFVLVVLPAAAAAAALGALL